MDVFKLRDKVIHDYAEYVRSFVRIRESRLQQFVDDSLTDQALWRQSLIQMNPSFEVGGWIDALVESQILHEKCKDIFRIKTEQNIQCSPMRLHKHQVDAISEAQRPIPPGSTRVMWRGPLDGRLLRNAPSHPAEQQSVRWRHALRRLPWPERPTAVLDFYR